MTRFATPVAALLAIVLLAPCGAQELPSGGDSDCANFIYGDGTLLIEQLSPDCIINWESFSIGAGGSVHFSQLATWRALNRVTNDQFSIIAGTLTADGTIYIVNPAGITFTGSAVIDVGGIYAAAATMTDADFLAGIDRFTSPTGGVVNDGTILANVAHLIGDRVVNSGSITAGRVTMLAGADEILIGEAEGHLLVRIDGTDLTGDLAVSPGGVPPALDGLAGVENSGTITATGGQVVLGAGDLYSLAIRNTGSIDAAGGSAQLAALGGTVATQAGGSITAGNLAMTGDVLFLDHDLHADSIRFNDPIIAGSDLLIEGATMGTEANDVLFASQLDSEEAESNSVLVRAALTTFQAGVGQQTRLAALDVTSAASIAGDILTTNGVTLGGDASLVGDADQTIDAGAGLLTAGGWITKAGSGSLSLTGGAGVQLAGDVTVATAAGHLLITGQSIDAASNLTANASITLTGPTQVGGSITSGTALQVFGNADIGGDLTTGESLEIFGTTAVAGDVNAGTDVSFFGDATIGGGVQAGQSASFFLGAEVEGDIVTGQNVTFNSVATLGGSLFAGNDASFFGVAEITRDVVVGNNVTFVTDATVGGNVTSGFDVGFFGQATVGGDVIAVDDASFFGPATIAGRVRAGDDATFLGPAVVGGDVRAAQDVDFFDDATVGGDVSAGDDASFFGVTDVAGDVEAADNVAFNGVSHVGGNVTAASDVEFFAAGTVHGDILAGRHVSFSDTAQVDGDVVAAVNATFFQNATIGGNVTAGRDIMVVNGATIGGDATAGDDVLVTGTMDVGGDVQAGDTASFEGPTSIGGDVSAVDIEFFADATIGGSVAAGVDVDFFGSANVSGDVRAGDDVTFFGLADVGGSVTARSDVSFLDSAVVGGDVTAGDDVEFSFDALVGGSISAFDNALFFGPATIGGNITATDVEFFAAGIVGGSIMTIDDVTFFASANIGGSVTAGDDGLFFGPTTIGGGVTVADGLEFFTDVTVGGSLKAGTDIVLDSIATIGGDVLAGRTIKFRDAVTFNGAGDQRIEARTGVLRASDNLIKTTAGRLTLQAGDRLVLRGTQIAAIGDILLNPDGHDTVPTVATIMATKDLSIVSANGDIFMGANEKFTCLRSLTFQAAHVITLGDVNAGGNLTVTAPTILLRSRAPGLVLDFQGNLVMDAGLDFVSGGRFFFSSVPTVLGGGPQPRFGSPRADADALGTLGAFRSRIMIPFSRSMFRFDTIFLDLIAQGPTITDLAPALAAPTEEPRLAPIAERLAPDRATRSLLRQLGIRLRPLAPRDLAAAGHEAMLYNDLPSDGVYFVGAPMDISVNRLNREAIRRLIDTSYTLLIDQQVRPETGEVTEVDRTEAIRQALGAAWRDYAATTSDPRGEGFRRFVEANAEQSEALELLQDLGDLLDEVAMIGLTSFELQAARDYLLDSITPPDLTSRDIQAAIEAVAAR